jgi:hypothetical protein
MQMLEFLCLAFENITELNLFEIKIDWWWLPYDSRRNRCLAGVICVTIYL